MADMYTPEEIQAIFDEYNEAIRTGTPITAELAKAMRDASTGIKGSSDTLKKQFDGLGQSAATLTKAMYKGEQGAMAMAGAVDLVADAVEMLILALIPGGVLIKAAVAMTVGAVKDYAKAAMDMSDKLYNTYHDLSRVGVAGQEGMSAVYTSMQKFGYGIEELGQMTELIRENSTQLARYSGTVMQGADAIAATAETIQRSGLQSELLKMGESVDDINRGVAGYYSILGRTGQLQGKTQEQLTAGTVSYLREMEMLSRLTGQTREDMEKQQHEADLIDSFLAATSKEGMEPGQKGFQARELYSIFAERVSPEFAKQFAMGYTGFIGEENAQSFNATNGALQDLTQLFRQDKITQQDLLRGTGQAVEQNTENLRSLAEIPGSQFSEYAGRFIDILNAQNLQNVDLERARNETKVNDGLTASAVELRQKQMATRDAMQDFVKLGVGPATDALNGLAGAAKGAARSLPGAGNQTPEGGSGSGSWLRDLFGLGAPKVTHTSGDLLDFIAKGESQGNYNQLVSTRPGLPKTANLVDMTIDQVQKFQAGMLAQGYESSAVGKYQIVKDTLAGAAKQLGLDTATTKFDQKTQDALAGALIANDTKGKSVPDAIAALRHEWPSLNKIPDKDLAKFISNQDQTDKDVSSNTVQNGATTVDPDNAMGDAGQDIVALLSELVNIGKDSLNVQEKNQRQNQ